MPTPPDDVRISQWSLTGSAGVTTQLQFTGEDAMASFSIWLGGSLTREVDGAIVTDVDYLTGATEYAATLTVGGTVATVDLPIPADQVHHLMRIAIDGVVQTVGNVRGSTKGTASPDNTITLNAGTNEFALTVLGVLQTTESVQDIVGAMFTGNTETGVSASYQDSDGTIDLVAEVTQAELDAEATTRAAADTALDARLDTIEGLGSLATDAELAAAIAGLSATYAEVDGDGDLALDGVKLTEAAFPDTLTRDAELADVATSGDYGDLDNLPTLGTAAATAATDYATAAQGATADAAVPKALYDANTILAATSDNTPAALTVAEQRLVGRITGGNIDDLTPAQARTMLGVARGRMAIGSEYGGYGSLANTGFVAGNGVRGGPIVVGEEYTIDQLSCYVVTQYGTGAKFRMGLYVCDVTGTPTGAPVVDAGQVDIDTPGTKSAAITPTVLTPGLYVPVGIVQGSFTGNGTLRGISDNQGHYLPGAGTSAVSGWNLGAAAGALPSVAGPTVTNNVPLVTIRRSA